MGECKQFEGLVFSYVVTVRDGICDPDVLKLDLSIHELPPRLIREGSMCDEDAKADCSSSFYGLCAYMSSIISLPR